MNIFDDIEIERDIESEQSIKSVTIDEAINLLLSAVARLRDNDTKGAAWRVADAGLFVRDLVEMEPHSMVMVIGVTCPTGRGATLPEREKGVHTIIKQTR
jgi:hypothetical protein